MSQLALDHDVIRERYEEALKENESLRFELEGAAAAKFAALLRAHLREYRTTLGEDEAELVRGAGGVEEEMALRLAAFEKRLLTSAARECVTPASPEGQGCR